MDNHPEKPEEGILLLDLLILLLKRKRFILLTTTAFGIIGLLVSFILRPVYRAETKILPPSQSPAGAFAQTLSGVFNMPGFLAQGLGVKSQMELYIEMLKSRSVLDRIIDRFDLMKRKKKKYPEDARKSLLKIVTIEGEKNSGLVTVKVDDRDPKRAAEMANAFIEELKRIAGGLAITEAAQRRLFFEEQLKDVKASLSKAEEDVRGFQETTGALQVDAQARAVIGGIAMFRAQIAAKEVQLKVLRSYATPQNPDVQKIEEELQALKAELAQQESSGKTGHDPMMPTGRIPSVGMEYLRKFREVKYNEILFELLSKQYEIARLEEARDAVVIQVIDPAVPPQKKYKPKRMLITLGAMAAGFLISVFASCIGGFVERSSGDPVLARKLEAIRGYASLRRKG
jgi:uncharacterized protein involved in exopolysaccharide biosynthesis